MFQNVEMRMVSTRAHSIILPEIARLRDNKLCVGILHSGGPAPGGNLVIAAAAKQFLDRGVDVVGITNGYEFLQRCAEIDPKKKITFSCFNDHFTLDITHEIASRLVDDPSLLIRTSRANPGKLISKPEDLKDASKIAMLNRILDVFEWLRCGALISIGGDDTLKTANFLEMITRERLKTNPNQLFRGIIHVPKTVDNDYNGIVFTFGFMTAAEDAGRTISKLYADAQATNTYHVVELMGRKAGWYASAASVYGRGTIVLIPEEFEAPINLEAIADKLIKEVILPREHAGKCYGVICIAEGLADKLPEDEKKLLSEDRHGNKSMSNAKIAEKFAGILQKKMKEMGSAEVKERDEILLVTTESSFKPQSVGYATRQVKPCLYDSLLSYSLGIGSYLLIAESLFGNMVSVRDQFDIYGVEFKSLIDPQTLKTITRDIPLDGHFMHLITALQTHF